MYIYSILDSDKMVKSMTVEDVKKCDALMRELEMDQLSFNAGYYLITSDLREKGVIRLTNPELIERTP